jgi:hypothetical protein
MTEHASGNGVPHHPDVHVEAKDVDARGVIWFNVILGCVLIATAGGMWGLLVWLNHRAAEEHGPGSPLAEQEHRDFRQRTQAPVPQPLPEQQTERWPPRETNVGQARSGLAPLPRLEGIDIEHPEHTIGRLYDSTAVEQRKREEAWLHSSGDYKLSGMPGGPQQRHRIPIDEAMKRLANRLPAQSGTVPEEGWLQAPTRHSSGRVPAAGIAQEGGRP